MFKISDKVLFSIITIVSFGAVGLSFYAEFGLFQEPCPLCIVQRILIAIIGLVAFIAIFTAFKKLIARIYAMLLITFSAFCLKAAINHIALINLPADKAPLSCGMPLRILYKKLPIINFLKIVLKGDAECAKVSWRLLGFPAPYAVAFLCLIILSSSLYIIFRKSV